MEEEIRGDRNTDGLDCRRRGRYMNGVRRGYEVDGGGAVMAEREADLTLVVRRYRSLMVGCGDCRQGIRGAARSECERVRVPAE